MVAHPSSLNKRLARHVACAEHLPIAARHELLDMLGLLDPTGRALLPDDTRLNEATIVHGAVTDDLLLSGRATGRMIRGFDIPTPLENLPEGLRRLHEPPPEEATRPPRPRPAAATPPARSSAGSGRKDRSPVRCGTRRGYLKHKREDGNACPECHEAYRAEQRRYAEARRTRIGKEPRAPVKCGTPSGRKKHYREQTTPCRPCMDAYNEVNRVRYHRLQALKKANAGGLPQAS